ncbi:hypothetical protein DL764_003017 [Monosporascus ibericus]|uniref:Uncharacterized protein n=1 Tax=Monosporascus ibericus TaxID=155417 RepID=A0A4Q4TI72_9PEZI|nr:hypothetical protein DL764_003017 [Monosporascus ibericus]
MMPDLDAKLVQGDKVETRNTTAPNSGSLCRSPGGGYPMSRNSYRTDMAVSSILRSSCTEIIANLAIYNMINHTRKEPPSEIPGTPAIGEVGYFGRNQRPLRPVGPVSSDNFERRPTSHATPSR